MWVVVAASSARTPNPIEVYIVKARSAKGAENFVSQAIYTGFDGEGKKNWPTLDIFREAFRFTAYQPVAVLDAKEKP